MKKLKIALYIPWIYQKGGVERTFLEIIKRSGHDWTMFTHRFDPSNTFPEYSNLKVVRLGHVPITRGFGELAFASSSMAMHKIRGLEKFDVLVISTAGFSEFMALRNDSIPTIAFCFTPLRVIHDPVIKEKYMHENPGAAKRSAYHVFSATYQALERAAWRKFKFAIVQSKEAAKRVLAAGLAPEKKLRYIHFGIDASKCKGKKPKKYFLLPGRINWTKNIELGIEAYRLIQKEDRSLTRFSLVIAGNVSSKDREYANGLKRKFAGKGIKFIEDPTDPELSKLYAECYCVLFTAINEDWGLIPIEAMAFSKPVIAANQGGPKESVADGSTGFLADPKPEEFAKKMALVAGNPKLAAKIGKEGRKRVSMYDWKSATASMDAYVEEAAGKGKRS